MIGGRDIFVIMGTDAQEKALINRIKQMLSIESEENNRLFFLRTEWRMGDSLARLTLNSQNNGELCVNIRGLRRALARGREWGELLFDFLCQYFAGYLRLSAASIQRMPGSYEEGLAICSLILQSTEGGIVIPMPGSLQKTVPAKGNPYLPSALYCETAALRLLMNGMSGTDRSKKTQVLSSECVKELLLWSELPEVMYTKGRRAQIAPLYIADGLEKQLRKDGNMLEGYVLFRETGRSQRDLDLRQYWVEKGAHTAEPFYEGMMVRLLGYDPSLWKMLLKKKDLEQEKSEQKETCRKIAEASVEYMRKTAHFIIESSRYSREISEDNRRAAESAAGGLRDLLGRAGYGAKNIELYPH